MVLFHDVVQVFPPDHLNRDRATKAFQHLVYGLDASRVSSAFVDDNLPWQTIDLHHPSEEVRRGRLVSLWLKHEIKRLAVFIDGPIEIDPRTLHLDVSLIHSPRAITWPFPAAR